MNSDENKAALVASLFNSNDDSLESEFSLFGDEAAKETCLDSQFLIRMNPEAIQRYKDHLKEQLLAGEGETIIEVGKSLEEEMDEEKGLSRDKLEIAKRNHELIIKEMGAVNKNLMTKVMRANKCTEIVLVREKTVETDFIEVRVAVVGNVDAGKSTLLGVLTHNALDDGRGQARQKLFRHKHEFETGRTSSVSNDILGFDIDGNIVNNPDSHNGHLDWTNICRESAKVITFIDLAGHEKYLKTTIFGMTGHMPDYSMIMIGANAGIIGTTREHLTIALSLNVPVFAVVTKIDMCPENILSQTIQNLNKLMKSPGARKRPIIVNNENDVIECAINFYNGKVCPIFQVSNVTGKNIDLLRKFLNIIPLLRKHSTDGPPEFQIDEIYTVGGVGTVISGTCISGVVSLNDTMLLGPDPVGKYITVPIKSIHRKRLPVSCVKAGQTASFAMRKIPRKDVRKGMVLLSPTITPISCYEFVAEIVILHHPTTITFNYQAMVHVGSVRQTAQIIKMGKDVLRTGDRDVVTFRFIRHPEYLRLGTRLVFREGRAKAVGKIINVIPYQGIAPIKSSKPFKQKQLNQQISKITISKNTQGHYQKSKSTFANKK
ncbi:Dgp-1 [Strongyloides ratti]|uniref:Dgp-1 n=1 Tax=Strongyloides ratti TaxID=34506 RepID=A0A090LPG0_STRRB|nr:Dgp-1 [Strongyloides ratti]CEF71646.1 Dgp-1 [Strongyloides ratti]